MNGLPQRIGFSINDLKVVLLPELQSARQKRMCVQVKNVHVLRLCMSAQPMQHPPGQPGAPMLWRNKQAHDFHDFVLLEI